MSLGKGVPAFVILHPIFAWYTMAAAVFMQHSVEMLVLVTDPSVRIASSRYPCCLIHFRYPFCTPISPPPPDPGLA